MELLGYMVTPFNFLRNCQSVSTVLHHFTFPPTVHGFPVCPYPCRHLLFQSFLIRVILVHTKWCLLMALMCVSLMTDDVEHLFMCLLAICVSSSEEHMFKFFAHFKIGLFIFSSVQLKMCIIFCFMSLGSNINANFTCGFSFC